MRSPRLALLLSIAALCALGGCSSFNKMIAEPSHAPNLVIVGGGLKDDNAAIHKRFVELCAEGPIGIIPTASGDGLKAGEQSADEWRKWSGSRAVVVIPLTKDDAAKADDPDIAKQIASCGGLWFTGGDQSRVTAVFCPEGRRTAVRAACGAVLDKNGVIGGTSAGAALMGPFMITGGQSRGRPSSDPESPQIQVTHARGMAFVSSMITDQHFLERGRMGRLIDVLNQTGAECGLGVRENCALVVHGRFGEAIGDNAVCVLHVDHPQNEPGIAKARLSVLSTGDRVDVGYSRGRVPEITVGPARKELTGNSPELGKHDVRSLPDPWNRAVVEQALTDLADGTVAETLKNDQVSLLLFRDNKSRVFVDSAGGRPPCLVNLGVRVNFPSPDSKP